MKRYTLSENEKLKIVFAPGCFDNLDMSQEELDEFVKMIQNKVEDGTLFIESRPLNPDDPEDAELLARMNADIEINANRKLQ